MRTLTPRDLLVELLKSLEVAATGFDSGSLGGGVRLMPSIYNEGSYAELERRMREMHDDPRYRTIWWNVAYRYWRCIPRRIVVPYQRTIKGPIPQLPARSELRITGEVLPERKMVVDVWVWDERVQPRLVDKGLERLLEIMYDGDTQRITLPRELLYLALGKEPPNGNQPRASGLPSTSLPAETSGR